MRTLLSTQKKIIMIIIHLKTQIKHCTIKLNDNNLIEADIPLEMKRNMEKIGMKSINVL